MVSSAFSTADADADVDADADAEALKFLQTTFLYNGPPSVNN